LGVSVVFLIAVVVAVGWRETRKEYVVLSAVDDVRGCRANYLQILGSA
jgi:hypothetical protein